MVLDATKDDSQKQRLERELETVGIRLNEEPPNVRITKTTGGGVKINRTMVLTYLDDRVIENILREYKIFNADVVIREDVTADQFIDVLEGNRKMYAACILITKLICYLWLSLTNMLASRMPAWCHEDKS